MAQENDLNGGNSARGYGNGHEQEVSVGGDYVKDDVATSEDWGDCLDDFLWSWNL